MSKNKVSLRERQRRENAAQVAQALTTLVGKKKLLPAELASLRREGLEKVTRPSAWAPPARRLVTGGQQVRLQRRIIGDQTEGGWQNVGDWIPGSTITTPAHSSADNHEYRVQIRHVEGHLLLDIEADDFRFGAMMPIEDDQTLALKQLGYIERSRINHLRGPSDASHVDRTQLMFNLKGL